MTTDVQAGGADWELGEAARKLTSALTEGDSAGIEAAMRDHAAAVGSKSTAMIAALFTPLMERQLAESERVHLLELESQNRATYFYAQMDRFLKNADARFDVYDRSEKTTLDALTSVAHRLDEITSYVQQSVTIAREALDVAKAGAMRLGKMEKDVRSLNRRMNASEKDRAQINERLSRIEQFLEARPAERELEHKALLDAIAERGDGSD